MRTEIMNRLAELHKQHGILFTSEQDAEDYYRDLVELIESLSA